MRGARSSRASASDLIEAGWLPPVAAATALGITDQQLRCRVQRGEIRRKEIAPGCWLYEVPR